MKYRVVADDGLDQRVQPIPETPDEHDALGREWVAGTRYEGTVRPMRASFSPPGLPPGSDSDTWPSASDLDAPPPPPPKWPGYSREWYAALLLELDGRLTVEIARRPDFWPAILWAIHLGYHWADARWRLNRGASTQIGATLREKNRAGGRAQAAKLHKHAPQWREWVRQETSRPAHRRLSNARLATMLAPRLKAATEITVTPRTIRRFLSEIRRNKAGR